MFEKITLREKCCEEAKERIQNFRENRHSVLNLNRLKLDSLEHLLSPQDMVIMKGLKCHHNRLFELPCYLNNVKYIDCSQNYIRIFPLLDHVLVLKCSHNPLEVLPDAPNLECIECYETPVQDILYSMTRDDLLAKYPYLKKLNEHFIQ